MRAISFVVIIILFASSYAYAVDYLSEVESGVYQTSGTVPEITRRAKTCLAQAKTSGKWEAKVTDADIEGGIVTADAKVAYRVLLSEFWQPSVMVVMAKDGRFKIKHDLGANRVTKQIGTSWEKIEQALIAMSNSVAECIQKSHDKDDW